MYNIAMKQSVLTDSTGILQKIESIEKDVMDLKLSVLKKVAPSKGKVIALKGILKGVDVSDKDISRVKKSLYDKVPI